MVKILNQADADFEQKFEDILAAKRETSVELDDVVSKIIADVRTRGDEALLEYTNRFDRLELTPSDLRLSQDKIDECADRVPADVIDALQTAHDRIKAHHTKLLPKDTLYTDDLGVELGSIWKPVEAVGLYVPGGLASYPSSVLMNAVPAKVAGVDRLAMVVPTPDGEINDTVMAAARMAGVTEIYRVGGAQAVAALAYGTQTIAPVTTIVGPGNAYVATAKKQVYGQVGIDMIAGPSDVIVIADQSANPAWVAADLLAQAEHGAGAQSIAIVTNSDLAIAVEIEVENQLKQLRRGQIAGEGWEKFGAIITVNTVEDAVELSNRLAPEHLELCVDAPKTLVPLIRNAGAVFLGHHTPEAVGDYVGGSNHVLPTSGTAKFASGLSTMDFMKRTSLLGLTPSSLSELSTATVTLAESEDLQAHGRSVSIRLNK